MFKQCHVKWVANWLQESEFQCDYLSVSPKEHFGFWTSALWKISSGILSICSLGCPSFELSSNYMSPWLEQELCGLFQQAQDKTWDVTAGYNINCRAKSCERFLEWKMWKTCSLQKLVRNEKTGTKSWCKILPWKIRGQARLKQDLWPKNEPEEKICNQSETHACFSEAMLSCHCNTNMLLHTVGLLFSNPFLWLLASA